MSEPEGIDTFEVGLFVAMGTLIVIAMVYHVQGIFYAVENEIDFNNRVAAVRQATSGAIAEQNAKLMSYSWRDKEAQRVSMPIDQAMNVVVTEQVALQREPAKAPASP